MTDHDKPMSMAERAGSMSESMVERVAKALYESWLENYGHLIEPDTTPWEELTGIHRSFGLKQARAAISAMREPTEGVIRAIGTAQFEPEELWQAMIDAALTESK